MQIMDKMAGFVEELEESGAHVLRFLGDLSIATVDDLPQRLDRLEYQTDIIDLKDIGFIDTVGAWLIHRHARDTGAKVIHADTEARRLIATVSGVDHEKEMRPQRYSRLVQFLDEVGEATTMGVKSLAGLIGFLGAVIAAMGSLILNPRRIRWNAIVQRFDVLGVRALGIIGLMSFLIGLVIAQQGAVQLRQFGAEIFTINLVGRLTLRELGVLMTAIMVAGRSGSAFAAQIGTMKITEEIDAMRTIGVSPIEALVLPRVLAAVLMMPLLGFYSAIIGIIGGGILSWFVLDIPPSTFFLRIREVVPVSDVYVGLIKAPVFGLIIALSGCYQGMLVEGNAEQVGLRTTAAVVQAIFMVIVLDAFFAVFFTWVGWG